MRVCLVSKSYGPNAAGGISRQRQVLARALTKRGNDVHVITLGNPVGIRVQHGVKVHRFLSPGIRLQYSDKYPALNDILSHSQGVCELIRELSREKPFDIIDAPLWSVEGFVAEVAGVGPVVIWLQTTLANIVELQGRAPDQDEASIIALEKESLRRAAGLIADSRAIMVDVERLYGPSFTSRLSKVIPLGLPDIKPSREANTGNRHFAEGLVVGRLEFRKGTRLLFALLPRLLKEQPRLRIRFIGADNSEWDGFFERTGQTYAEYFLERNRRFRDRVVFEGEVPEERLMRAYREADFVIVPSLYESFGLVFLEAMRAALPVVAFGAGAAQEIFPRGEGSGAVLVSPGNEGDFIASVGRLAASAKLRTEIGESGRARFLHQYLDDTMADKTEAFYREVREEGPRRSLPKQRRVFQVMEALDTGDAVSSITLRSADVLREMGAGGSILGLYAHPDIEDRILPVGSFDPEANAALIFHYWNYSRLEGFIRRFRGPKAIYFHNITPPHYFTPGSVAFRNTRRGYAQLARIASCFDLIIGHSQYNLSVISRYLNKKTLGIHIYPVIDIARILIGTHDRRFLEKLRQDGHTNIVFVGRVVRNKRQDRLMRLFEYYYRNINRHARLWLIGNDNSDRVYRMELEQLRSSLRSGANIIFTGTVPEAELGAYYRLADIFVCASEHEGFCIPVAEAMAFDVPVLAYAAAAIQETLGSSGILVREWSAPRVAELMHVILNDASLKQRLIESQRANLGRFSVAEAQVRLQHVVNFLRQGEASGLFEELPSAYFSDVNNRGTISMISESTSWVMKSGLS